jgi:DNA-binding CsgD family transcriptional regulator
MAYSTGFSERVKSLAPNANLQITNVARLTQRRLRCLLDCIGEVYAHQDLDSFARGAVEAAAKAISADYMAYSEMNVPRKRVVAFSNPDGVDFTMSNDAKELFFREHPLMRCLREKGDVPAARISDFLTRAAYRETGLYREIFRKGGVEFQMGCTLPSPSAKVTVTLTHNRSGRDFSEEDRLTLNLLRPHLFQAYRNAERLSRYREEARRAERALNAFANGVILLKSGREVAFASQRAQQWLQYYFDGRRRGNGRLPAELEQWVRRQQLPAAKTGKMIEAREPFTIRRDDYQLTVWLTPGSTAGEQTLLMEVRSLGLSSAPLQRLGLTPRQAEVLLWVAQGKTTPEIGVILGLSAGTVRKHVEHIFQKLGVETRTGAARRAFETLGMTGE